MRKIDLLDCTLRDGGYVNNWHFGRRTICDILKRLDVSGVEYIECGYLSEKKGGDPDDTQFGDLAALKSVLPAGGSKKFAVMIDLGQYDIDHLPQADEESPIIRVCFHKKDAEEALEYCRAVMAKGYRLFVQPMASLGYSDVEFVALIEKVNALMPEGFYIVDSFGVMELEDFQRMLFLAENDLDMRIKLGYHSHNNLQQAYGNAKFMAEQNLKHDIILDASVYGMGRGAGNLNTELFAAYLNRRWDKSYSIDAFMDIMDEHIKPIFAEHYWGYSLPFYLSAQYNCHPNYAGYYSEKNTLSNRSMKQLLSSLPEDVKNGYSAELAEKYYQLFQENFVDDSEARRVLSEAWLGRDILVLAPGRSIVRERERIEGYIREHDPVVVAVNVAPEGFDCQWLICTNEKRFKRLTVPQNCKLILTSNLSGAGEDALVINYASYLTGEDEVSDNPAVMLFQLMKSLGIERVTAAGLDGYSVDPKRNYFDESLSMGTSIGSKLRKNDLIRRRLSELRQTMEIDLLTESLYQ